MAILHEIDTMSRISLDCIDDRGLVAEGTILQNIKTPAGVYGLAQDLHVARLTQNPDEYEKLALPFGESAKIIARRLGQNAIMACTHQACAAEQGVTTVARTIIEKPEETIAIARQIYGGDITATEYETVANAYGLILFSGLKKAFRSVDDEAACMDRTMKHPALPRKTLANKDHVATSLQVNHRRNTWFNADAQYAENPSYHTDQWAVPVLAEKVDDIMPHNNIDGFVIASSIRTAATSLNLPYGGDSARLGLDIRTIAA